MNIAHLYVETINRIQSGESLAEIPNSDLEATLICVAADVHNRLGRLNRFPDARAALERASKLVSSEHRSIVQDAWLRESSGGALSVDEEAAMTLNSTSMLQAFQAEQQRRAAGRVN
ncbi:MAG: hypothetical protein FP825_06600 [Hyphomonas sp.]|uniref:hypothetical protein n=1 Tax=Hyphomonas sp. TaxID=87 RepID=UPI0017ACFB01|nr:hypothetical protein [Hyphomonas sp.]MBA3068129.1 hypothetical protein [Hyphomonas sp.]MBU3922024.1 hypothetical protein [Alphaproteobacteria bacterium]MBU4061136.1 hypothetical protein [Alphaproteobacteria bacterium]MBU4162860.1 hypothetical protein [Alphaproteobacteria bacterium]